MWTCWTMQPRRACDGTGSVIGEARPAALAGADDVGLAGLDEGGVEEVGHDEQLSS